ncbi:MAG: M23 family metallopeptidase [Thermoanaerobaculia bacterium]|nr:M23 family metallopeptidase [Thermoanaerobaculia bacterium]
MTALPTLYELQIHPARAGRRVWSMRLTRRDVQRGKWLGSLVLALTLTGLVALPWALGARFRRGESGALEKDRVRLEQQLSGLTAELEVLAERSADLRVRLGKISHLYSLGLPMERPAPRPGPEAPAVDRGRRAASAVTGDLAAVASLLQRVAAFEVDHRGDARVIPALSPLLGGEFVLLDGFGERENPFTRERDFHPGLDLAAPSGTPIRAPADGTVVFTGQFTIHQSALFWRYGQVVVVDHGGRFLTVFGHCREILARLGQRVRQGEMLATVGSSGVSSSPHLHYEVRRLGLDQVFRPVDPRFFILDHRWQGEEERLAEGLVPAAEFEPIPGLGARSGSRQR